MTKPLVIDLYRNDPVLDFSATKASGIIGVIHKCTEGVGWSDSRYADRRKMWMNSETIAIDGTSYTPLWGAYHFFHGQNPLAEARYFLERAEPDDNTCMALDWEDVPRLGPGRAGPAETFVNEVEQKLGRSIVVYSGNVAKEQIHGRDQFWGARRLWLAQYGTKWATQPSWDAPWLWQNNGDAYGPGPHNIAGIQGLCDNNCLVGLSVDDFVKSWGGGAPHLVSTPAPSVPVIGPRPRKFENIIMSNFGGPNDRQRSAYGGPVDPDKPIVALPFHFMGARPEVIVEANGQQCECEIDDVGPHTTDDPYWRAGTRPRAESMKGNKAGIDATPAVWKALGLNQDLGLVPVTWWFNTGV